MAAPYYPPPGSNPADPMAKPNTTPAPPPPAPYQNTPAGRASYLEQFSQTPWYNGPLFDSYLQSHPDWPENVPYWNQRFRDAPGTGSNAGSVKPRNLFGAVGADPQSGVPQTPDLMAQILEELRAQQTGDISPRTRNVHLDLLGGGR